MFPYRNRGAAPDTPGSGTAQTDLTTMDIANKWIKPISGWAIIRGKLDIVLPNWDNADAA